MDVPDFLPISFCKGGYLECIRLGLNRVSLRFMVPALRKTKDGAPTVLAMPALSRAGQPHKDGAPADEIKSLDQPPRDLSGKLGGFLFCLLKVVLAELLHLFG